MPKNFLGVLSRLDLFLGRLDGERREIVLNSSATTLVTSFYGVVMNTRIKFLSAVGAF